MQRTLKFHIFETLDSTQTKAKALVKDSNKLHVIMAFHQTKGQGTLGKSWVSPEGSGLYMSLAFHLGTLEHVASLSHLAACAVALSLDSINPKIKWPNDILIKGEKIAGVLTKVIDHHIYSGLGINLKFDESLKTIDQPVTSYDQHQKPPEAETLCPIVAEHYLKLLNEWEKSGFKSIKALYIKYFELMHKEVIAQTPEGMMKGVLIDFSDEGYPILKVNTDVITLRHVQHVNAYS